MRNILFAMLFLVIPFSFTFTFQSCSELAGDDSTANANNPLGWLGIGTGAGQDNTTQQESDINLSSTSSLPSSVNIVDKFPPIGNQGQYGTCVAWAVAYNCKTVLEGIDQGWSGTELAQTNHQGSPKYLFWSVPSNMKGSDCNGTGFEPAFDVLMGKGCAMMSTVPYTSLGNCSGTPESSWDQEASKYKIENYRKIAEDNNVDVKKIKKYLSEGRPVVFGAKLGDNFMTWTSSSPISSDTYTNPGMQHAYHAMILSGYDDSKSAFRVVNSWGTTWGDNGYIWVDYDFFANSFCFAAYVAQNKKSDGDYNPDPDGDGNVEPTTQDVDLLPWQLEDILSSEGSTARDREITYNVYNVGNESISKEKDWYILYLYYNAYDANDYGIIIADYYTDDFGDNERHYDVLTGEKALGAPVAWWNYGNIGGGQSVGFAVLGEEKPFKFDYQMPNISGKYFLVLIADAFDVVKEANEDNNYYFLSAAGEPITIENGEIQDSQISFAPGKKLAKRPAPKSDSPMPTLKNVVSKNTYSPREIMTLLKDRKVSGELAKKAREFMATNKKSGKTQTKSK